MVSAANSAACSGEKRSSPASSSGRSIGVRLRKSQTPCRSGEPHAVRGADKASVWATAPTGASVTRAAAVSEHAINRQFIFYLQDFRGGRPAQTTAAVTPDLGATAGLHLRGTNP